jgi:hypothetical protein
MTDAGEGTGEARFYTETRELVHRSGGEKRLAREGLCEDAPFGSSVYPFEEIVVRGVSG